jgi:AraC-like DNA-binding protein
LRYVQTCPPRALADFVACLWAVESDGHEPQVQRILPDGRAEIIFHLADPFRDAGSGRAQAHGLVAGQLTHSISLKPGRRIRTLGIRLNPAGMQAFVGTPHHLLTDTITPLDDVHRPFGRRVLAAQSAGGSIEEALDSLAGVLLAERPRPVRPDALNAFGLVERRAGLLTVDDLRTGTGLSFRTLERIFLNLAGVPPRLYLRLVRFRHAVREAEAKNSRRWTDVALACGYYDHAHFTRDF